VRALREGKHHYSDIPGIPRLRDALAQISEVSTGVATGRDNVIATIGGQAALFGAAQACVDPGDHAIIVSPYYATYPGTFRLAGAEVGVALATSEDGFQPTRAALEAAVRDNTRVLLINSPNNPTGTVYSPKTLAAIAEFCIAHDLWLISDEVYWSVAGAGRHLSPLALPDMAGRTLVVNSLSKSHAMTGWRVGWLRAPNEVIRQIGELNLVVTYGLPEFISWAAAEAAENRWGVDEIAVTYAKRRELFLTALAGANSLGVRGSEGGMYVMLDVRAIEPSGEAFAWRLLEEEAMAVMPGESYGPAAAGHIRVSLCLPEDKLKDAAARLKRLSQRSPARRSRGGKEAAE
jgi:arginine:pyruvate transaminase